MGLCVYFHRKWTPGYNTEFIDPNLAYSYQRKLDLAKKIALWVFIFTLIVSVILLLATLSGKSHPEKVVICDKENATNSSISLAASHQMHNLNITNDQLEKPLDSLNTTKEEEKSDGWMEPVSNTERHHHLPAANMTEEDSPLKELEIDNGTSTSASSPRSLEPQRSSRTTDDGLDDLELIRNQSSKSTLPYIEQLQYLSSTTEYISETQRVNQTRDEEGENNYKSDELEPVSNTVERHHSPVVKDMTEDSHPVQIDNGTNTSVSSPPPLEPQRSSRTTNDGLEDLKLREIKTQPTETTLHFNMEEPQYLLSTTESSSSSSSETQRINQTSDDNYYHASTSLEEAHSYTTTEPTKDESVSRIANMKYTQCNNTKAFQCDIRKNKKIDECIHKNLVCDSIKDCSTGRDEALCTAVSSSLDYLVMDTKKRELEGYVLVRVRGSWHPYCTDRDKWTLEMGEKICHLLGYTVLVRFEHVQLKNLRETSTTTTAPDKDANKLWVLNAKEGNKTKRDTRSIEESISEANAETVPCTVGKLTCTREHNRKVIE